MMVLRDDPGCPVTRTELEYGLTPNVPNAYRNLLPSEDNFVARLAAWTQE